MTPAALLLTSMICAGDPVTGLKVPDGFVVTQFAGPELANDIYCLHIDSTGRVLVSGRGYVRYLPDENGDGKADQAIDVIPPPTDGPMGLLWENNNLFVTSDGGLKRYHMVDGKSSTTERPKLVLKLKTGGEHDAHAVKRGPDGKLWVLCGNMAGVNEKTITAKDSPVEKPVAGCLLRLNDDGSDVEVIADGFRNPYDFDFDARGIPYTFDSDNERCLGLPWYEPTRLYQVMSGGNYGWLSPQHAQTWRKPPYYADVIRPLVTAGRGSPTGIAYYRHFAFPRAYRGNLFYADWTFGKIYHTHPDAALTTAKVFLEATGENGFAPTGLAVHPTTGDLYVSVGGRGTRGSVYRIAAIKPQSGEVIPYRAFGPNRSQPVKTSLNPDALATARGAYWQLQAVRGWQLGLGDLADPKLSGSVWEGYSLRKPLQEGIAAKVVAAARAAYPSGNADVDRELSRILAAVQDNDSALLGKVITHMTKLIDPVEQVHDLIVLGRLTAKRTDAETAAVADAVVHLDGEYERRNLPRDRHWSLRLTEVLTALCQYDPRLLSTITNHPDFGHADHLWLAKLPGVNRLNSARAFVTKSAQVRDYPWSAGHVEFIAELPEAERRPLLLKLVDRGLADSVAIQLAKRPVEADRERFITGLSSASAEVTATCAKALAKLPNKNTGELVPLIRALRRFADPKADMAVRREVIVLLKLRTREQFDDVAKWEAWLHEKHAELAKGLSPAGYDAAAWRRRLAEVNWEKGDAASGKVVFAKVQCGACHNGGTSVGPSLAGVHKRFSRDDLLTTILDPSRDISPRYRTTKITTTDDRVYEGVIIYEANDGVILQTDADSIVRLVGKKIESKRPGTLSLMPVGLMDSLSPTEIADLMAYLKSLDTTTGR